MTERKDKTIADIKEVCGSADKLTIIITQVDPDALGAAMLFRYYLISFLGKEPGDISIVYSGTVSHSQNRAIINMFELDTIMTALTERFSKADNEAWILIDSNLLDDKRIDLDLEQTDIIIDHHRCSSKNKDIIYYLSSVGSACTLVTEILMAEDKPIEEWPEDGKEAAITLASIGIRNDTHNFTSEMTKDRDWEAFSAIRRFIDNKTAQDIENYNLTERDYSIMGKVLETRRVSGTKVISSAGYIHPEDADQLAESCNFLIRDAQISLAVVWGIVIEKGIVRLSLRSRDLSLNLDTKIKEVFGENKGGAKQSRGYGEGGAVMDIRDLIPSKINQEFKGDLENLLSNVINQFVSQMLRQDIEDTETV